MSNQSPAPAVTFEPFTTEQLIDELRARGFAVAVFNADDLPVWVDYGSAEAGEAWFLEKREELEGAIAEFGNNTLDAMALDDELPELDDEEDCDHGNGLIA